MFVLGHVGLTLLGVRQFDRDLDPRGPALLAIAPDLIDKPIAWLAPGLVHHNTRGFGHTLLVALLLLATFAWARERLVRPWLLWCCYAGHFVLDRLWLWDNPAVLFWPLLGPFPAPQLTGFLSSRAFAYNLVGEAAGLAALAYLWRRRLL